jgi:AAA15 family ATPase/GTPase
MVKLKSSDQPVPIGSMGDGIWRMLALSIAIALSKSGTLLVDEIDTGLHYTVMSKMWNLIYAAAKQFDVQVFATTHSYDCVHSLAQIPVDRDPQITVQRIEAHRPQSVPYDQEELTVAASREIEVR